MSDAINWKTIKIPEGVRDKARDDPRTYGEIVESGLESRKGDATRDEILRSLEQIQNAQGDTVKEALEIAEGQSEVDLTPVLNRIDDLETELTNQHERLQR